MIRKCVIAIVVCSVYGMPGPASAVTYTGTYTNGLTVSEDNALVENADISNSGSGVCLRITGNNVTVKNSKIHSCQDHGVIFLGTDGGILENSEVYQAAMRNAPGSISGGWPSLVKVQSVDESTNGLAKNIIIRNNYIHEGYGECMGLRGSHITVTGNYVKDCYSVGIYSNSDHTTVSNNYVHCTGNSEYHRDGLPMSGIGFAEETFSSWGAHGHNSQTVTYNVVAGCKYGFRYGTSDFESGLSDTTIAYNTFSKIIRSPISITHYPSENNVSIHDNVITDATIPLPSAAPPIPPEPPVVVEGDLTGDGHVNLADYNTLVKLYGSRYTESDYTAVMSNYGR